MKKTVWIILFLIVLLVDLFAVYSTNETLRYITKPLLMPLLVAYFIFQTNHVVSSFKKWTVIALIFSWTGDVLLMFESMNGVFFILGLAAFLIAHIFYIILFDLIRVREKFRQSILPLLPIAVYYLVLISLLQPHLGEMKKAVSIYGLIISFMLSFSIDLWRLKDRVSSYYFILGALLFITSDSLLAINKFYQPFENAGIAVMLTYGIAQLLITLGATRYITSTSKQ